MKEINNNKGIVLMLMSSIFVCTGQLSWKLSENNFILLGIGFVFYGLGALIMIKAYSYGSLSVLQPMLSLNYIFTLLLAYFVLNEKITLIKVLGIMIITAGVYLIAKGDKK